jgi:uncharacterized protein YhhL (DUF1145 family)
MEKLITGTWLVLIVWGFGVLLFNVYKPFPADSKIWQSAGLSFFLAIMVIIVSLAVVIFQNIGVHGC